MNTRRRRIQKARRRAEKRAAANIACRLCNLYPHGYSWAHVTVRYESPTTHARVTVCRESL